MLLEYAAFSMLRSRMRLASVRVDNTCWLMKTFTTGCGSASSFRLEFSVSVPSTTLILTVVGFVPRISRPTPNQSAPTRVMTRISLSHDTVGVLVAPETRTSTGSPGMHERRCVTDRPEVWERTVTSGTPPDLDDALAPTGKRKTCPGSSASERRLFS